MPPPNTHQSLIIYLYGLHAHTHANTPKAHIHCHVHVELSIHVDIMFNYVATIHVDYVACHSVVATLRI